MAAPSAVGSSPEGTPTLQGGRQRTSVAQAGSRRLGAAATPILAPDAPAVLVWPRQSAMISREPPLILVLAWVSE